MLTPRNIAFLGNESSLYFLGSVNGAYLAVMRAAKMRTASANFVAATDETAFSAGYTAIALNGSGLYSVGDGGHYVSRQFSLQPLDSAQQPRKDDSCSPTARLP